MHSPLLSSSTFAWSHLLKCCCIPIKSLQPCLHDFYHLVPQLIVVITPQYIYFFKPLKCEHSPALHTCLAARQNNFLRSPEINLLPPAVVQAQKVVYLIDFIFHSSGDTGRSSWECIHAEQKVISLKGHFCYCPLKSWGKLGTC